MLLKRFGSGFLASPANGDNLFADSLASCPWEPEPEHLLPVDTAGLCEGCPSVCMHALRLPAGHHKIMMCQCHWQCGSASLSDA